MMFSFVNKESIVYFFIKEFFFKTDCQVNSSVKNVLMIIWKIYKFDINFLRTKSSILGFY